MKNLAKSVMNSSIILVSYILYAYFGIIREAEIKSQDHFEELDIRQLNRLTGIGCNIVQRA